MTIKERLKKMNAKNAIRLASLLFGLLLIVLITVAQLGIDPEKLNLLDWLANTLILIFIMVFGLLMGESIFYDRQREKSDGLYSVWLTKLQKLLEEINPFSIHFSQWYRDFTLKELRDKKIEMLIKGEVDAEYAEAIVDKVKLSDLEELGKRAIKIGDVFIEQQNPVQIEAIRYVLEGNVKLNASKPSYFLSAFDDADAKYESEQGRQYKKEIAFNKQFNRGFKIVSTVVISAIWGMFTVRDFMDGADMQAWMNLVTRVFALVSSLFSGGISSVTTVKIEAKAFRNKYSVVSKFKHAFISGSFVPVSANEKAKAHYEKYLKELEEAKNNVVDPEVEEPNGAMPKLLTGGKLNG